MSEPSTSASPAASSSSSAPQRGNDAQRAHNARAQHGNFHAYYHIRAAPAVPDAAVAAASAAAGDPRVPLILEELQRQRGERQWPLRLLDVGCNAGKMTFALATALPQAEHVLGVDIDAALITLAQAQVRRLQRGSAARPPQEPPEAKRAKHETTPTLQFEPCDWPRARLDLADAERHVQLLSKPPDGVEEDAARRARETQVRGKAREVKTLQRVLQQDESGWDCLLALSLTKWVHLQHHDIGLLHFLARLASSLRPLGVLVLEAQPWASYEQARRVIGAEGRRRHASLRLRPDDFEWWLAALGLEGPQRLGSTAGYGFQRALEVYIQPAEPSAAALQLRQAICAEAESAALRRSSEDAEAAHEPWTFDWVPREGRVRDRKKKKNAGHPQAGRDGQAADAEGAGAACGVDL